MDVDGSSHLSADSQPKSVGLVWGLVATQRSVCIHQMNRVNSCSDYGDEDSTINVVDYYYYYYYSHRSYLPVVFWPTAALLKQSKKDANGAKITPVETRVIFLPICDHFRLF